MKSLQELVAELQPRQYLKYNSQRMTLKGHRVKIGLQLHINTGITSSYHIKKKSLWEIGAEQQPRHDWVAKGHMMTLNGHKVKQFHCVAHLHHHIFLSIQNEKVMIIKDGAVDWIRFEL